MTKRTFLAFWALGLGAALWVAPPLRADVTGAILGTITDPSGAAVPGATVTLRNPNTGLSRQTTTDSAGYYEFLVVPVGENYVIEVEAAGFRKATQLGIKLLVNQKFRADFQLVVGPVTQTVSVTAEAAQVESTSTQLGDVIEDRKMTNLPLNGRSYIDLLGLQPGVVPLTSGASTGDRPVSGTGSAGNFSVNGQREQANAFLVNGGDVEEGRNNGASVVPTLDSIQEFRLLTNSFDAEYGRFSGAIVNVVTKAGTNEFHGTAYEFVRNDKLDSRNFFASNLGAFKRNQFGGALGGPILKDRVFFFGDYQGTRERRGVDTGIIPVPSALERGGNFSDVGTIGFNPLTGVVRGSSGLGDFPAKLSSRLGYTVNPGEPYWFSGTVNGKTCLTQADALAGNCVFPGEMIPTRAWSPAAGGTLQFVPNFAGVGGSGTPFFESTAFKQKVRDDKLGARIDLSSQRTGSWNGYYHLDDTNVFLPFPAAVGNGSNVPGFASITPSRAQQINLSNTHTLSPTTVNEVHLNFTRTALLLGEPAGGLGKISSFGFVEGGLGIVPANPSIEGVPQVSLNQLGITFGTPSLTTGQYNNTYQVADGFSKVIGKHTAKLGGEVRYLQINERNSASVNAAFSFNGGETGNDFADFLLGAPDSASQLSRQFLDSRTKYFGLYGQDTYKVKSNFTLNYGLRWEASEPFYDTQGKIQGFVPGEQSRVFPNSPTGWVFPGDPGIPKTIGPTRWDNFAPRAGFAYSPGFTDGVMGKIFGGPGKTSIRAASGIYYTAIEDLTLFFEVGDAPFGQLYTSPTLVYLEEPYKDRIGNNDPGQRFPFSLPVPSNTKFDIFQPISFSPGFKTDNVLPYAEHFNFSIQRELGRQTIFTVAYVGTRGHHLVSQYDFNPGNVAKCLGLNSPSILPSPCGPNLEDTIYTLPTGAVVYGTRPYSVTSGRYLSEGRLDFSGFNTFTATDANSNYNSLQAQLEKRVGAFTFLGGYTWSKSIDNSSGYADDNTNPYNPRASRSLSAFDLTHNFVVSYGYDLPFTHWLRSGTGAVHKALDGWKFFGVTRFTTGLPILMHEFDDFALCGCGGVDRPNYNAQPIQIRDPRNSANNQYFVENYDASGNPVSPFFPETVGVAGNANRRFFHGPGLNNWDLVLQKYTALTERMSLEFRAEFFNGFDHAQFTNPSGDVKSRSFGRVTSARDPRIGQLALKLHF